MTRTIRIKSLDYIAAAAAEMADCIGDFRIFAFYGPMGVGKTTFINALCRHLGTDDVTNSPSFSIVNEYLDRYGRSIYHFDCYRFENPEEALDIGIEEYFDSDCLCLIEWPERIEPLLPPDTVTVTMTEDPDTAERTLTLIFP